MTRYLSTSSAVATYVVIFRDGTSTEIQARRLDVDEHGLAFSGRKNEQQGMGLVAFIPHGELRMVSVAEKSKVTKARDE
ncbi:hypothetical protein [Streptomyces sp. NPDC014733]|uniref:hypothetical protein n=1 Tax=Streptomyces sp. NPDC014733 TaxID=3364885 RepID=UPI0036F722BE